MAARNSTDNCSPADLEQCYSQINCHEGFMEAFDRIMRREMWQVNALLLSSAVLAGVIVGIGAYGQRYRHRPITRFIYLGTTTLFLPIVSSVVSISAGLDKHIIGTGGSYLMAKCRPHYHSVLVIEWAYLIQMMVINTSTIVAIDHREGPNIYPPFELLVQGVWTLYIGISYVISYELIIPLVEVAAFAIISSKIVFKYYAFVKALLSFALGRNPRLVFGYMHQLPLQEASQNGEPTPPPLLVMGEERQHVVKEAHGYVFKDDSGSALHRSNKDIGLVTMDRVWSSDLDSMLPMSTPARLKDLCLSFALFKLLRCRFARCELTNAGSKATSNFFWSLLLKDGEHDRAFAVITDEVSFVHDYYYSSLPVSYSKCWLPILSISISLLSIGYCIFVLVMIMIYLLEGGPWERNGSQMHCHIRCIERHLVGHRQRKYFGSLLFDLVPILLLLVLAVTAEVRDMASYIFSNWTKVSLICRLLSCASLQRSLCIQKWVGILLRCRCRLMKHWDEKMGQRSVLVLERRTSPLRLLQRLFHLPEQKRKVKVTAAVKVCIMNALRRSRNGCLSNGTTSLRRWGQVGESFLWACCSSKTTSENILTWHIATSILEVRHPHQRVQEHGSPLVSDQKIAAIHLSRYFAYLMTWCAELLPNDEAWSKSLYADVKKDAECAIANQDALGLSSTPEVEYQQLVELLTTNSKHEVLKNGVRLGKQLVELTEGEDTSWKLLVDFWSEKILYVAPSDNLKGHLEAIARGGELITVLWVSLFHAGIVGRTSGIGGAASDGYRSSDNSSAGNGIGAV